jgi:hypothetical protein
MMAGSRSSHTYGIRWAPRPASVADADDLASEVRGQIRGARREANMPAARPLHDAIEVVLPEPVSENAIVGGAVGIPHELLTQLLGKTRPPPDHHGGTAGAFYLPGRGLATVPRRWPPNRAC